MALDYKSLRTLYYNDGSFFNLHVMKDSDLLTFHPSARELRLTSALLRPRFTNPWSCNHHPLCVCLGVESMSRSLVRRRAWPREPFRSYKQRILTQVFAVGPSRVSSKLGRLKLREEMEAWNGIILTGWQPPLLKQTVGEHFAIMR